MVTFKSINDNDLAIKFFREKTNILLKYILFDTDPQFRLNFDDQKMSFRLPYNSKRIKIDPVIFSSLEIETVLPEAIDYFIPLTKLISFGRSEGYYKFLYKSLYTDQSVLGIVTVNDKIKDLYTDTILEAKYRLISL